MHICGADNHAHRSNARETGLLEEILLENKHRNPSNSFDVFDLVLWEKAYYQENLDLYLNSQMTDVEMDGSKIKSVSVDQLTNETRYRFVSRLFVDASGDGTLGYLAGADYRTGRESNGEFGEKFAPPIADDYVMGSSIQFTTKDMGRPVPFVKPDWAYTYSEEDLTGRDHSNITSGYWWIEVGGDEKLNTITDAEEIRDELLKVALGIWDHIKNGGDHGAQNYALDWIGFLPGKRESRRFEGDYILTANDILENKSFEDAIAYGGWPMDVHVVGGINASLDEPTTYYHFDDVYQIPYRCLYSKNISNLFLAGRLISASHMAFGSTRVMATCSVIGQAVGLAASIAIREGLTPRATGEEHIKELQQTALSEDLYVPGLRNLDENDLARGARVTASSCSSESTPAGNVVNGVARTVQSETNFWESASDQPEWLAVSLETTKPVSKVNIKFDSNLSQEIMPSLLESRMVLEDEYVQHTLEKDFDVCLLLNGREVARQSIRENYLRNNWIEFEGARECDEIRIDLLKTNGDSRHRIFEIRCY